MNKESKSVQNADYAKFEFSLRTFMPDDRIITDPLRTLAYGTDASFYRLTPRMVVTVINEREVVAVLQAATAYGVAITFRAAGTSLSGQAVTDSVLVRLGFHWRNTLVKNQGETIQLQPGVIGADANRQLKPYGRKIGPDPASINTAMIGGIAANNASGMCCGTTQNSYQTLESMRIVFSDGSVLDTGSEKSRTAFLQQKAQFISQIKQLKERAETNADLRALIRKRYRIKNTTGYGLNALLDFDDPIDIIQHLMIGSEGTLGFIAEITYKTVIESANKATALLLFPDIGTTAQAVARLSDAPVAAVELMDRAALKSIESQEGVPAAIAELNPEAAALLVEVRGDDTDSLASLINQVTEMASEFKTLTPVAFSTDQKTCDQYWKIRKGLFPAIGAMRDPGTTVIIEDVAFSIEHLAAAVKDLQALFQQYEYHEAIIFGHALAGNLHFVFTQDFSTPEEIERYAHFMDAVCHLVVDKYDGSLKAEHGTGRNIAPFVELEWGVQAYGLMRSIKSLFDPLGILNPDVLISSNPKIHLENLKPLYDADPIIDKCIECGFCEPVCPSKSLTLTPRQRIVAYREIAQLQRTGDNPERLAQLEKDFQYQGVDTCAVDGLCATACPVGINTGDLTLKLRQERNAAHLPKANFIAKHFNAVSRIVRFMLYMANLFHRVLGTRVMTSIMQFMHRFSGKRIPLWLSAMPKSNSTFRDSVVMYENTTMTAPLASEQVADNTSVVENTAKEKAVDEHNTVVYFPSCASRTMGAAKEDTDQRSLTEVTVSLLKKAGYQIRFLKEDDSLCCGMPFQSKGLDAAGDMMLETLNMKLLEASEQGRFPIISDTSPCVFRMRGRLDMRLKMFEPVQFAQQFLVPRLTLTPEEKPIALHVTCSTHKLGLADDIIALARQLSHNVIVPEKIYCCGFAGDLGFRVPELNASALEPLHQQLPESCEEGISTSRTCEIGLTEHGGVTYHSLFYLLDRISQPKEQLNVEQEPA